MPNRIIKESICDSEKLAALSDFEFRLWVGLITQADDAGRGDARPAYIKGHVFPFRERVTTKDIDAALHALAAGSCVTLYTVGGRPYYSFPSWAKHQRIRDCKPKYPGPEDADLRQSAADCGDLPQAAADCGGLRPESNPIRIQSESNPKKVGAGLYPAVDVIQQLRQMRAWLIANPRKKKTKSGINRFIVTWLSKEQDRGGVYGKEESRGQQGKPEYRNVGRDL